MRILKNMGIVALLSVVLLSNGCASYIVAKGSQRDIASKRIIASQDKGAIDALKMGVQPEVAIKAISLPNGAGIAVDLLSLDTLSENPAQQAAAAVVDAALIYGGYRLVQSATSTQSGNNNKNTTVNINNASHTEVNTGDTTTTTTTDDHSTVTDDHTGAQY